ncbi:MAG: gamma-glutamyl-gamma-aminobutyrate hydrolase family protein [Anaerolineae bacterium]
MAHPIIGIPVYHAYTGKPDWVLPVAYPHAILAAGGVPLLLPLTSDEAVLDRLIAPLDGLLLAGGGDVETCWYGAKDTGKLTFVDSLRDHTEIALTRRAARASLPIFGICRGAQVLNVALGGTLIQDIPSQVPGCAPHRLPSSDDPLRTRHDVTVTPGSLLADALGLDKANPGTVSANSRHHQAVADLAPGFVVSARSTDGIVEALELPGRAAFVLGVQWHPENMVPEDGFMTRLFRRFVATCDSREFRP